MVMQLDVNALMLLVNTTRYLYILVIMCQKKNIRYPTKSNWTSYWIWGPSLYRGKNGKQADIKPSCIAYFSAATTT